MFDMSLKGITNSLNLEIHISPLHPMDLFHSLISPNFVTLNKTFVQKIYKRLYFNMLLNSVLMGGIPLRRLESQCGIGSSKQAHIMPEQSARQKNIPNIQFQGQVF